jgi:hypothetical protein
LARDWQKVTLMRTILATALTLAVWTPVQAQPGWEGETKWGRATLRWKILDQSWDGSAHCLQYETAISNVRAGHFALERVYGDRVESVEFFADRFPHEMFDEFFAVVYKMYDPYQAVSTTETARHKRVGTHFPETHCTQSHPNTYPVEIRFVIQGIVREDGKLQGDTTFLQDLVKARIDIRDVWRHWLKVVRTARAEPSRREALAALERQLGDFSESDRSEKHWGDSFQLTLWGTVQEVQGEPEGFPLPPERFLPELERLLQKHIREIEKSIPKGQADKRDL